MWELELLNMKKSRNYVFVKDAAPLLGYNIWLWHGNNKIEAE